jgi:hypothetical protein
MASTRREWAKVAKSWEKAAKQERDPQRAATFRGAARQARRRAKSA